MTQSGVESNEKLKKEVREKNAFDERESEKKYENFLIYNSKLKYNAK